MCLLCHDASLCRGFQAGLNITKPVLVFRLSDDDWIVEAGYRDPNENRTHFSGSRFWFHDAAHLYKGILLPNINFIRF